MSKSNVIHANFNTVRALARETGSIQDHQNEQELRPLYKKMALYDFTDVLRKAMRGIQEVSNHQELAAIVAKLLNEMVEGKK